MNDSCDLFLIPEQINLKSWFFFGKLKIYSVTNVVWIQNEWLLWVGSDSQTN